ncbi:hypothetical protein COCNU_11G008140 [Cocos nucifera]|uniref:Uncharacterized protein n=1 Tax=Cocos nucifera TaxID=13894 RepID=A0A8K0IPF2_COCNU|nr:hypothetical protein COCNU_11G008140 [Cocos nucifera]
MMERRLGRGWKAALRRSWWEEGRMRAASALLTHSPSTVPIRTSEFVIADRRAFSRFDGEDTDWRWRRPPPPPWAAKPLWRLQRKEPGWVVGEHMQVFLCPAAGAAGIGRRWGLWRSRGAAKARERSMEKRTEEVGGADPTKLTRVGEDERWKKLGDLEEKLEAEEEAKAEAEEDGDKHRPLVGEIDRRKAAELEQTEPSDLLEFATAIDGFLIWANQAPLRRWIYS